ncbi:myTH4 domain protein [Ancylostoma duodenale]|uniref:MyTH4 domain protein n=1 Tax=Ancylostoma duodenale TaxID=51022 RepID=A0A0C2FX59_9BILA|nr:myTH4 domain protein [Ancylostoma duodenale]
MGDRKSKTPIDQQALTLCELGLSRQECADEAVAQLMQQLTDNERPDSVRRGWELLAIFLNFVTPSEKQAALLTEFIDRNSEKLFDRPEVAVSHFAQQCAKRMSKSQARAKPTLAAVQEARDFLTQREPVDRKRVELVAQGAAAATVSIILPEHVDHAPQGRRTCPGELWWSSTDRDQLALCNERDEVEDFNGSFLCRNPILEKLSVR